MQSLTRGEVKAVQSARRRVNNRSPTCRCARRAHGECGVVGMREQGKRGGTSEGDSKRMREELSYGQRQTHVGDCEAQTELRTKQRSTEEIGSRSWVTFTSPLYLYRTLVGRARCIIHVSTCAVLARRSSNRPLDKLLF